MYIHTLLPLCYRGKAGFSNFFYGSSEESYLLCFIRNNSYIEIGHTKMAMTCPVMMKLYLINDSSSCL